MYIYLKNAPKALFVFVVVGTMFLFTALFSTDLNAKPQKTGVHNYLGTDGKWHYVTTYKDDRSGDTWSSEWVDGDGPTIYAPKKLPYYEITGGGSGGNNGDIEILTPCPVDCEFTALASGTINVTVDDPSVEFEIIKIDDGSVFLSKIPMLSNFKEIFVPVFLTYRPYGFVLYKNNIPIYMELFFFDGSRHNSIEPYSSPGYTIEYPPLNN